MSEKTIEISAQFKKLLEQVYKSLCLSREEHTSVVRTLAPDGAMIFEPISGLSETKNMSDVFNVVSRHCSYFNYDLLQLIVKNHGTSNDKDNMEQYIKSFTAYCEAMPCAERTCGSNNPGQIELLFKITFDRHDLKPNYLRRVKINIAKILKVTPSSLYLHTLEEGCVLLKFLIPPFLFDRLFPLHNEQRIFLYREVDVIAVQCNCHVVSGIIMYL